MLSGEIGISNMFLVPTTTTTTTASQTPLLTLWPGKLNTKEQSDTYSENFPMRLNANLHSAKTFDHKHHEL